jgi:hypothetical protein
MAPNGALPLGVRDRGKGCQRCRHGGWVRRVDGEPTRNLGSNGAAGKAIEKPFRPRRRSAAAVRRSFRCHLAVPEGCAVEVAGGVCDHAVGIGAIGRVEMFQNAEGEASGVGTERRMKYRARTRNRDARLRSMTDSSQAICVPAIYGVLIERRCQDQGICSVLSRIRGLTKKPFACAKGFSRGRDLGEAPLVPN